MKRLIARALDALSSLVLRHSKQIAIASLVLGILAIAAASRLSFDPDLLNLIPQKNKQVNEFRDTLRALGTIDYHIVVIQIPPGRDPHDYDSVITNIAEGYRKAPGIEDVSYRVPNPMDFVDVVLPRALLFLTPQELTQVAQQLSDKGIHDAVVRD